MIQTLDKLKIGTDESKKVLGAMSDSIDKLTESQRLSRTEFEKSDSISKEYNRMNNTSMANLQKMKNTFDALSIKIGNAVLPIMNSLLKSTIPIVEGIANWIERNKGLAETLAKIVIIGGSVALAISGISFAVGAYQKVIALARLTQLSFNLAVLANPYVLAGAAVVGLTALIMKYTGSIGQANMKQEAMSDISLKVANRFASQQVHIQQLFETLRTSGSKTDEYKDALQKLETIQPGITEKYNLQTKAIDKQNLAQKRLIYTLRQKLEEEVMYETKRDAMKNLIVQRVEMQGLIKKGEGFDKQSTWNKDVFGMILNSFDRSSKLEDINKSKSTIDIINQFQKEKQNKNKPKEDQKITVEIKGNNGDAKVTATNGINLLNAVMNQQMPRLSSTTK
jgi:hypothetical protein